jgi:hypothetical protein
VLSIKAIKKNPKCSLGCVMTVLQVAAFGTGLDQAMRGNGENDCVENSVSDEEPGEVFQTKF